MGQTMKLWQMKAHEKARVVNIDDQTPDCYRVRLYELGLESNTELLCLREAPFSGPKSYQISDSIFSFDEDLARFVMVERIEESSPETSPAADPSFVGA